MWIGKTAGLHIIALLNIESLGSSFDGTDARKFSSLLKRFLLQMVDRSASTICNATVHMNNELLETWRDLCL
jgi:hypothetical protein